MITSDVISTDGKIHESEDYQFLRREGVKYVEELSSNFWTDFNVHDPGITFLEAICYAITDLGYRTSFPMKDLLAKKTIDYSKPIPPLFTARDVLTNNPLTITDYRKILVDIDGIENAWLAIADCQEVDFYANCKKSQLDYFALDYRINFKEKEAEISKALSALKDNPDKENLKFFKYSIIVKPNINGPAITYALEISLPGWFAINNKKTDVNFTNFLNLDSFNDIEFENIETNYSTQIWRGDIIINYTKDGVDSSFRFNKVLVTGVQQESVKDALKDFLEELSPENPIFLYHQKVKFQIAQALEHTVRLRGLWEVLLQYSVDDQYGDLNSNLFNYTIVTQENGVFKELNLEILGPAWDHIFQEIKDYEPFLLSDRITAANLINSSADNLNNLYTTDIEIQFQYEGNSQSIIFENIIFKEISNRSDLESNLIDILIHFKGRLSRLNEITRKAECKLHQHRNLCEDFKNISSISVNEIGVCADIELENAASLIKTQAEIIFRIQQYISPPIPFYSLKEMVGKEIPTEQIFNGPKLDHGFIIDEEIEKSSLDEKRFIYASDIINIIHDVPGVISVKNLLLTKYDKSGDPVLPSEPWCLRIDPLKKAELSIKKSKILFFKSGLPYILTDEKYKKMLTEVSKLKTLNERYKLINTTLDFPVPEGTLLPLEDYTPIRFSLPQTYGVGITGLPEAVSDARKAKAKQLKTFLSFFDQILANYLSQLANLNNLFSVDPQEAANLKRTYYNQFINEEVPNQTYLNAADLEDNNPTIGANSLQRLTESHDDYLDRRNRFLDHLLARFAEDFTEYALVVFNTQDDETQQELINDKASFLKEYPVISSERGKGFSYKHCFEDKNNISTNLWNTENVVGLKKRVSKLLGMPNFNRQNYHCPTIRDEFEIISSGTKFTFQLKWGDQITHTSPKKFDDYEQAFYAMEEAILYATSLDNYLEVSGEFYQIKSSVSSPASPDIYLKSETFASDDLAEIAKINFNNEIKRDFSHVPLYEFHIEKDGNNYRPKMLHRNLEVLISPTVFANEEQALNAKRKTMEMALDDSNYFIEQVENQTFFKIGIFDSNDLANILCESTATYDSEKKANVAIHDLVGKLKNGYLDSQFFDVLIDVTGGVFSFYLKNETTTILKSLSPFTDRNKMLKTKEKLIELSFEQNNYTINPQDENDPAPFFFQLGIVNRDEATDDVLTNEVLAISEMSFLTHPKAMDYTIKLQKEINADPPCQVEGMHIIEHLLLRPKNEFKDDFFDVCLDGDCLLCGQEDPYSFRVSVVFPYWLRNFLVSDPKLKKRIYVDRLLRQEAPAHVHLKICWIDNFQMRLLDIHYQRWLEENAKLFPDSEILSGRLNALLDILGKLRSRYPVGFLHDCDDSKEENTILLNKTFIGSYTSPDSV